DSYYVLKSEPGLVVLIESDDYLLCSHYDSDSLQLDSSFTIINLSSKERVTLIKKDIGHLKAFKKKMDCSFPFF
ncbi:MAG: hypothetical protein V3S06_06075, partial [candidate division Zixibacteria bacterium]